MRTPRLSLAAALLAALLVTACGGSDYNPPPLPQDMRTAEQREDDAASASVAGLMAFVMAQIAAATSDATEPRNVGGITPPVSDTDEPVVL